MSFKEFVEATEGGGVKSETPPLGGSLPFLVDNLGEQPKECIIRVRYFVGDMDEAPDRAFIEDIMSRSIECLNTITKIGDVSVFREDTTFTKEGSYIVAIKYGEAMSPQTQLKDI